MIDVVWVEFSWYTSNECKSLLPLKERSFTASSFFYHHRFKNATNLYTLKLFFLYKEKIKGRPLAPQWKECPCSQHKWGDDAWFEIPCTPSFVKKSEISCAPSFVKKSATTLPSWRVWCKVTRPTLPNSSKIRPIMDAYHYFLRL